MRCLAIDPGANTGFALFDTVQNKTHPIRVGVLNETKMYDFLQEWESLSLDCVVAEDYIIRIKKEQGGFDHAFDRGNTLRMLGRIELRAFQLRIPLYLQQSYIKKTGYGFAGIPKPAGHAPHDLDAIAHGFYFLVKKREMLPRIGGPTETKPPTEQRQRKTVTRVVKGTR